MKCFQSVSDDLDVKSDHGWWQQSIRQRHTPSEKSFSISVVIFVEVRCSALTGKLLARLESVIISANDLWQPSQHYSRATNRQRLAGQMIPIGLIIWKKSITKWLCWSLRKYTNYLKNICQLISVDVVNIEESEFQIKSQIRCLSGH
jgi:hypothetical protein